jgi:thiamine biosynthesis lipoprotein
MFLVAGAVMAREVLAIHAVERRVLMMGTRLDLRVEASDRALAVAASQRIVAAMEAVEERLSTWRDDSELAAFNRAPVGEWAELSPQLGDDLAEAVRWARATDGAFDPTVGALVNVWGLRIGGREPSPGELIAARATVGAGGLEVDGQRGRRLVSGVVVEEGGFGKGVALREGGDAGVAAGATCVVLDLGGQWLVTGACSHQRIGVADPGDRQREMAWLELANGSVATSGNSERSIEVGGVTLGHLLDPRTGRPAPDHGSVTVVVADPVAADCLATAVAVLGPEVGPTVAARAAPGAGLILARVDAAGRVRLKVTRGLETRLTVAPTVTLEVLDWPVPRATGPPISG